MISAKVQLSNYANTVLNVVKAKYNLHDKSEALNKFIEQYGENEVEREVTDEYLKKVIAIEEKHLKKHGRKSMNKIELDKLFGK